MPPFRYHISLGIAFAVDGIGGQSGSYILNRREDDLPGLSLAKRRGKIPVYSARYAVKVAGRVDNHEG